MKGGELRLEIAGRLLFPAFATISGSESVLSAYPSPPKTPTAVCNVLKKTVIIALVRHYKGIDFSRH